jgi:hypothetical protein
MEIPIELFLGFTALFLAVGIVGFIRNPQVPAMIVISGIFILTLGVITNGIIMGAIPTTSVTSGSTTNYSFEDNVFEFTEMHKTLFAIVGAIMMLMGGLMVGRT